MKITNYFINKCDSIFTTLIKNPFNVITNICVNAFNSNYANKDVILILKAKDDENGALATPIPRLSYSLLSRSKVKIVKKTVSNIEDINQTIESLSNQGAKIKALWLRAHSSPHCIGLGKRDLSKKLEDDHFMICNAKIKSSLETQPKDSNANLLQSSLDKLDKDAIIVLDSCEAGLIRDPKNSDGIKKPSPAIAQTIAEHASNRLVYAPIREIDPFTSKCKWVKKNEEEGYKLEVKFTQEKASIDNGIKGILKKAFYNFIYLTGLSKGVDVTAKFRQFPQ